MHRLKKAIKALREYLGRDAQGLALLDEVDKTANALRKGLNAEKEKRETAEGTLSSVKDRMGHEERRVSELQQELNKVKSQLRQRDGELARSKKEANDLWAELDSLVPDAELPGVMVRKGDAKACGVPEAIMDVKAVVAALNHVRKDLRVCPHPGVLTKGNNARYTYELSDIIKNYDPLEMMKLGRFVACLAMFQFPATVVSSLTLRDCEWSSDPDVVEKHYKPFIRWFRSNLSVSPLEEKLYGPHNKAIKGKTWVRKRRDHFTSLLRPGEKE